MVVMPWSFKFKVGDQVVCSKKWWIHSIKGTIVSKIWNKKEGAKYRIRALIYASDEIGALICAHESELKLIKLPKPIWEV